MKLRTVLIDDEQPNIDLLENLLMRYFPEIRVVGKGHDVEEALELLTTLKPDLVFLDVELHDKTAFDVLRNYQDDSTSFILVTAYEKYALEAVNQQVQGYLLKPVVITEFVAIVQKVKARLEKAKQNELERLQGDQVKMLAVMARDQIELLQIDDIMRMEAKGSYTTIHCANGNIHLSSKKLKEYEDRLPSSQFLRVHHSHIVNLKFVQKMLRTRNGNLIMNDQTEIPISPNKKKEVSERIIM